MWDLNRIVVVVTAFGVIVVGPGDRGSTGIVMQVVMVTA